MDLFKLVGKLSIEGADEAERQIKDVANEGEQTSSKLGKLGGIAKTVGKGILVGTGAAVAGSAKLIKSVSSSYGRLQQSIGGVETLFGKSADKVIKNAERAYTTAGISANDYMEQITSFSASLLQSVGGDTEKAAKAGDMAVRDMADNANKMGTAMEDIQNAYQGFSKQNYTMLDNLKLGYGGTKSEMERLLKDAEKLSGQKYDISNLSDVYNAIHVVQQELGITGTTAKEGAATVEGSFNSLGAAWENFIAGLGNPDADMKKLVKQLSKTISAAVDNVTPIIKNIVNILPDVTDAILKAISKMLPTFIKTFAKLITQVINAITKLLPQFIPLAIDCILTVTKALLDNLPLIVEAAVQLVQGLVDGITKAIPTLIPTIIDVVVKIANTLVNNAPKLLKAGIDLILGLTQGLLDALPTLIAQLPKIIKGIVDFLVTSIPQIIQASIQLFMAITQALPQIIQAITDALPQIIDAIVNGLISGMPMIIDGYIKLFTALMEALPQIIAAIVKALPKIINAIVKGFGKLAGSLAKVGKEAFSKFWSALGNGLKSLPSKVATLLGYVVGKVTAWASKMAKGAKNAGESFVKNVISFVKNLPGNIQKFLSTAIKNVQSFARNMGEKGKAAASNLFNSVVNGIKNLPENVMNIGKNVVEGLWKGITNAKSWLENKIKGFASNFIKGFKKGFDIHSPSKKMEKEVGEQVAAGLIKGVDNKKENAKKSAEELSKLYVSAANDKIKALESTNKITLAQEIGMWEKVVKECKKGTEGYKAALNNLNSSNTTLKNSLKSLKKDYISTATEIKNNLKKSIAEVESKYKESVKSSKDNLMSQLNLFDGVELDEATDKTTLTSNLETQVEDLKEYQKTLDALKNRAGVESSGLYDELKNTDVKSLNTLKTFESMSDEELKHYIDLYKQKKSTAKQIATSENEDVRAESDKEIETLKKNADKQISSLTTQYTTKLVELGVATKKETKKIGKELVNGIKNGMNDKQSEFKEYLETYFGKISKIAKKSLKIKSPSRVMMEIGNYVSEGLGVGIDKNDSVEQSIQSKVNSIIDTAEKANPVIDVKTSLNDVTTENPMQKYQLNLNTQMDNLSDGFERLLALVGQYLPGISENASRDIVLDGSSLAVGISRNMDTQLGKIATSRGRGNV